MYLDNLEEVIQNQVNDYLNIHRFGRNNQNYVFVIKLLNLKGGKNFGIMYANASHPDLVGKYISNDVADTKGKFFCREYLQGLRENNNDPPIDLLQQVQKTGAPCYRQELVSIYSDDGEEKIIADSAAPIRDQDGKIIGIIIVIRDITEKVRIRKGLETSRNLESIGLPAGGMGGKETISKLLKIDPQAKTIVSSGYSHDDVMANYQDYGFQGVAAKPYLLSDLNKVIQNLIH